MSYTIFCISVVYCKQRRKRLGAFMPELWSKEKEIEFFNESRNFTTPEQLFYLSNDSRYYAYWPKSYKGEKTTLQSRNALIVELH